MRPWWTWRRSRHLISCVSTVAPEGQTSCSSTLCPSPSEDLIVSLSCCIFVPSRHLSVSVLFYRRIKKKDWICRSIGKNSWNWCGRSVIHHNEVMQYENQWGNQWAHSWNLDYTVQVSFIILLIDFLTEVDGNRKVEHERSKKKMFHNNLKIFLTGLVCVAVGDVKGNAHFIDPDVWWHNEEQAFTLGTN